MSEPVHMIESGWLSEIGGENKCSTAVNVGCTIKFNIEREGEAN